MRNLTILFCLLFFSVFSFAQKGRIEKDLSNSGWKLWLDTAATWSNDTLYPPPVALGKLAWHLPTGGWNNLYNSKAIAVKLPATVEQFYWGANGNPFGVSGNYLGVSWFYTTLFIPASYKSKRVTLAFESVRFRAEVFY